MDTAKAFIDRSRAYLTSEYLPKIRRSIQGLGQEDLWWRPNPASNSVGNLILHLAGNARQWVVSGIGGEEDVRCREDEFSEAGGMSADELLRKLESAMEEVDRVLLHLPTPRLEEKLLIQGMDVSVFEALYHVVEHFSMHTGQIIYLSKLRSGHDLGFYQVEDGKAKTMW
ncbi:DUF1572 family protein [Gemmatimonadota bacterium]